MDPPAANRIRFHLSQLFSRACFVSQKTLYILRMSNNEVSGDFGLPQHAALVVGCWEESQLGVAVACFQSMLKDRPSGQP
jgi:hypothetical protein